MNRDEMVGFINKKIDDGNWLLLTELEEHGIVEGESESTEDEVPMWLDLDTS